MPVPIVAIIGRPNVGKSSLFNRILRRQEALTFPQPGVTRDRKYAQTEWNGKDFIIIDTGGIEGDVEKETKDDIILQVKIALKEANLILFMVDSRDGVTPVDKSIAAYLRKEKTPAILVINKVDNKTQEDSIYEFYKLGWDKVFPVSCTHGRNISELLDEIADRLPEAQDFSSPREDSIIKIAIVGKPNVGKSSLVNNILGEERVIVSDIPGTTRDPIDTIFNYKDKQYLLVDTAGLKKKSKITDELEKLVSWKTITSINRCDIALLLIDAIEGPENQEMKIADLLVSSGKACFFLVNKWDLVKEEAKAKENYEKYIQAKFAFLSFAPIFFISAKTGEGVKKVLEQIPTIYYNYCKKVSTGTLNRLLQDIKQKINPPVVKGKRVKIKYITQAGAKPPVFILSSTGILSQTYIRYIKKRLYNEFDFTGTPLIIKTKYKNKGI